jgi:hypothetical protein
LRGTRRLFKVLFSALPLALAYLAWPCIRRSRSREAIVAGDADARPQDRLEARASLKTSISAENRPADGRPRCAHADLVAAHESGGGAQHGRQHHRSLRHAGESTILLGYRRIYRGAVRPTLGLAEPPTTLPAPGWRARASIAAPALDPRAPRRLRVSHRFVLEVEDR